MAKNLIKPELLAPAGSPMALRAAIEGGADAIYMGGAAFNARINAKNFTQDELKEGIALAHAYGVKVYVAANTLIFDKEREDYLRAAEVAYLCGADALIVADVGMAKELKKRIPIDLHASTQLSGHNLAAAKLLLEAGFSRMVCAREMSCDDLREFCHASPIEAEVFVHGALCVSTSGQCLFSSIVGGRSGNRGECAQPCRLPYSTPKGKQSYPLSLCDLSLAEHLQELCDMGVASLKIEGRMKSPEYVRDVVSIWRRLLDEGRNATPADMRELAKVFSRGGFTDGYYTRNVSSKMLGVRSQDDKNQSAQLKPFDKITKKVPLDLTLKIRKDEPITLTARTDSKEASVTGPTPDTALTAPLTQEVVKRNISKLGATPYELRELTLELDDGLMLPLSALNALRRSAVDALAPRTERQETDISRLPLEKPCGKRQNEKTALFYNAAAIPTSAKDFFDVVYVPLEHYEKANGRANGVMLPEVIFDTQLEEVKKMLTNAKALGAEHVLLGNIGHFELVKEFGLRPHGDFRLNATNSSSAAALLSLGFEDVILSPELSLAQLRDIGGRTSAIVYGRLPLMLTEKCIGKELGSCERCNSGTLSLSDRMGVSFPVMRRFAHRSVVFNSLPVYMADRADQLTRCGIISQHFIFTVEGEKEATAIISAYTAQKPPASVVRRIK